jgi:hypothetical protein
MATVLLQAKTCDGYDVHILDSNETHVLHFTSKPSDLDAAIANFLVQLAAQRAADEIAANMEIIQTNG